MTNFQQAFWVELLKVRRSRMPLFTGLGFALVPLAGGFFMIVMKDPALARRMGLISVKAQIMAGSADWPAYFSLLDQAAAIGGFVLCSLVITWVFGREWADRTVTDLLALPTPRRSIVLAKFVVTGLWSLLLALEVYLLGLIVGTLVGLPPVPLPVMVQNSRTLAETAGLAILLINVSSG